MSLNQIWAPWRLNYILENKDRPKEQASDGCFLCRYIASPENDEPNHVLFRSRFSVTLLNRFPYNAGHLLVAPLRHLGDFSEMTNDELLDCQQALQRMVRLFERLMSPGGFNVGINLGKVAGAGLPGHLHWHLVPRWEGDVNFMPVLANVQVIPQSLEALHKYLVENLGDSA